MKPGDLVELCNEYGHLPGRLVLVVNEDLVSSRRYIETGTLAVFLKKKKGASDPAVVILVDGQPGWVWQDEIRPASGATAAGP